MLTSERVAARGARAASTRDCVVVCGSPVELGVLNTEDVPSCRATGDGVGRHGPRWTVVPSGTHAAAGGVGEAWGATIAPWSSHVTHRDTKRCRSAVLQARSDNNSEATTTSERGEKHRHKSQRMGGIQGAKREREGRGESRDGEPTASAVPHCTATLDTTRTHHAPAGHPEGAVLCGPQKWPRGHEPEHSAVPSPRDAPKTPAGQGMGAVDPSGQKNPFPHSPLHSEELSPAADP